METVKLSMINEEAKNSVILAAVEETRCSTRGKNDRGKKEKRNSRDIIKNS